MSGIYWSLTALSLLVQPNEVDELMKLRSSIVDWVFSCYDPESGGFGGNTNQDGHVLYTLSALQILALAGALSNNDDSNEDNDRLAQIKPHIVQFLSSLQQPDGSFAGDGWGEVDTRFTYCALSSLSLLGALDSSVDVDGAAAYIASCQNFDGGFGCTPGAESHAGQIFTCIAALSIAGRLDLIRDVELLAWWLAERQCDSGGLNGRPEKQADVCYSWWILSSLCIMGRVDYIRGEKLASFILKCQDDEDGGIADRPGDMADVFHTFFGIAGLSLIGSLHEKDGDGATLKVVDGSGDGSSDNSNDSNKSNDKSTTRREYRMIDPVYALPTDVVQDLQLKGQIMKRKTSSAKDERLQQYDIIA